MKLVSILDSNVDKHLLSTTGDKHNLITQIKNQGSTLDLATKDKIIIKYHLVDIVTLLKYDRFILIEEKNRIRVFLIED